METMQTKSHNVFLPLYPTARFDCRPCRSLGLSRVRGLTSYTFTLLPISQIHQHHTSLVPKRRHHSRRLDYFRHRLFLHCPYRRL